MVLEVALLELLLDVVAVVVGLVQAGTAVVVVQVVLGYLCCAFVGTCSSQRHLAQCSPCSLQLATEWWLGM